MGFFENWRLNRQFKRREEIREALESVFESIANNIAYEYGSSSFQYSGVQKPVRAILTAIENDVKKGFEKNLKAEVTRAIRENDLFNRLYKSIVELEAEVFIDRVIDRIRKKQLPID